MNLQTLEEKKLIYAIDLETSGLDRFKDRILCVGVSNLETDFIFDNLDDFSLWLERNPCARFIAHSGSFDFGFLRHNGLDLRSRWVYDTRTVASLLIPRPESLGLEPLAEKLLGKQLYKLDRTKMSDYSREQLHNYCLTDCRYTFELYNYLRQRVDVNFVETWILPATFFCADMEYDGVYVEKTGLEAYSLQEAAKRDRLLEELKDLAKPAIIAYHENQVKELSQTYKEMYEKAREKAKTPESKEKAVRRYALLEAAAVSRLEPFNFSSPKQLGWLLRDYYGLSIRDRDGEDSTAEVVLRSIDHPLCQKLCDFRESEKLVGSSIPALLENIKADGHVHTRYNIGGTRTGRLSSSGPNLQQIPKGPLRGYVRTSSMDAVLVTIDFAQIEVRIIAEVAKEEELINAFKEDIDPYSVIAQKLLKIDCPVRELKSRHKKERDVAKTAGLSILYGTGAAKLQEVLNKELALKISLNDAKNYIVDYRKQFHSISTFKKDLEETLRYKRVYKNLLGRPFIIEDEEDIYMKSLNTLVQGSASDLVVYSAVKVKKALDDLAVPNHCRLLIHDETVWELPADEAEVLVNEVIVPIMTTEMEKEFNLAVPLKVEYSIDERWSKP